MPQVLIVDDSPTIRRMVRASLNGLSGNPVFHEAASGLEAIERVALSTIDLMVLDLNMPDMHGLEVLQFLRGHQKYTRVPVIVLTTRADDAAREGAFRAGATSFVTKPFAPAHLADEARKILDPAVPDASAE